jgi:hypothetical protein
VDHAQEKFKKATFHEIGWYVAAPAELRSVEPRVIGVLGNGMYEVFYGKRLTTSG